MSCPSPEDVSRHADSTTLSVEIERHIAACATCGAIAQNVLLADSWLRCPDAEAMAVMIERGVPSAHVEACTRCAVEFRALRPATRVRRLRRRTSWMPAMAAAAVAAIALVLVYVSRRPLREVARQEPPGKVEPVPPVAPAPPNPPSPVPPASAPVPPAVPAAPPVPPPSAPPSEPLPPPPPSPPTVPQEPARVEVAVAVKSGALTSEGRKVGRVYEGMSLRTEGRTRVEFAGALVSLDPSSRLSLSRNELSLTDGALSAECPRGCKFALVLGQTSIVPMTASGRVLLVAREDRVLVEEGAAKAGDLILAEGVEHDVKSGKRRARSLPAAARARESLTWRLDIQNQNATRGKLDNGKLVQLHTGRALQSVPRASEHSYADIQYFAGGEAVTFELKSTTAIRFRYFVKEDGAIHFQIKNKTKDENFSIVVDGVAGAWTTLTLPVFDIPVNTGGRKVACEPGDKYGRFSWLVGKPGQPAELLVDRFEVVEVEPR